MASFQYEIPEEFEKMLQKLSNIDEIAPKMIDAATPLVVESIKIALKKHERGGELIKSVGKSKPKKAKTGGWIGNIYFAGYDREDNTVSNNQKAISLEYGTSKQDETPFMQGAVQNVESQAADAMQEVYNKEVGE